MYRRLPALRFMHALILTALIACGSATSEAVQTQWDAWPWMTSQIPASVHLSARLGSAAGFGNARAVLVAFTNPSSDSVTATFGSCSFGVRLYRDSTMLGTPVWDDNPGPNVGCTLALAVVSLSPHSNIERQVTTFDSTAAAAALPAGRYRLAITWRATATGPVQAVPSDMISLP